MLMLIDFVTKSTAFIQNKEQGSGVIFLWFMVLFWEQSVLSQILAYLLTPFAYTQRIFCIVFYTDLRLKINPHAMCNDVLISKRFFKKKLTRYQWREFSIHYVDRCKVIWV